jgi:hypothetical protein
VVLAGCGSDDGALLTFAAPGGPGSAARIQIVLASANTETIGTGIRQRMKPGALDEEDVVYYRQRANGGLVDTVESVDGFQMRIEPELEAAPDEQFIPFALIFDEQSALVGVGAVEDPDGNPMPVTIREDERIRYTMTVTPISEPAADMPLAAKQGELVGCLDDRAEAWTSGVAWRPEAGPQLRLLLADVAADPGATDASDRVADLDCDDFDAATNDCDDLRDAFHPGQPETCDGLDTDCDGRRMEVQACALPTDTCGGHGVSLCTDTGANAVATQCQPDPTCACLSGAGGSCARCIIDTRPGTSGASRAACVPAIGKLHVDQFCEDGCQVEVVDVDGGFDVTLAAAEMGPYGARVQSTGFVYLRSKIGGSFPAPAMTYTSVGRVFLAITNATRTQLLDIDLEITDDLANECRAAALVDNFVMTCTP